MIPYDLYQRIIQRYMGRLHTHLRKMIRLKGAFPWFRIFRLCPAQISHRRSGIRNARIDVDLAICRQNPLHITIGRGPHVCVLRILPGNGRHRFRGRPGEFYDHDKDADPDQPEKSLHEPLLPTGPLMIQKPENERC